MASKQVDVPEIGVVSLFKRKGTSSIKLSITARGGVRVTMPHWVPYEAGLRFVRSRRDWILQHSQDHSQPLIHGQPVGKSHRLIFEKTPTAQKVATRVTASAIYVTYPAHQLSSDAAVQSSAEKASIRALRAQAEASLPDRTKQLAQYFDFQYRSVSVKQLSGRWGSCDSHGNVIFNLFLMQLPWDLIDYVILHELTHTKIMKHGPLFWEAMATVLPDVKQLRTRMRRYRPSVTGLADQPSA